MNLFFQILFLIVLTATDGLASGRFIMEYVGSPVSHHSKTLPRMVAHQKFLKLRSRTALQEVKPVRMPNMNEHVQTFISYPKELSAPRIQKRFYSTKSEKFSEQIEEDTSQIYAIPTYDGTFKYVLHDKQICRSFLDAFIPNENIVNINFLDSHLRPFKEFQITRSFINDQKSRKVISRINSLVTEQGAKDLDFLEHAPEKKEKDVKKIHTEEVRKAYERIKSSNLPKEVTEENQKQFEIMFKNYSKYTEYLVQQAENKVEDKITKKIARDLLQKDVNKKTVSEVTNISLQDLDEL